MCGVKSKAKRGLNIKNSEVWSWRGLDRVSFQEHAWSRLTTIMSINHDALWWAGGVMREVQTSPMSSDQRETTAFLSWITAETFSAT
jgi:hypothetical protein